MTLAPYKPSVRSLSANSSLSLDVENYTVSEVRLVSNHQAREDNDMGEMYQALGYGCILSGVEHWKANPAQKSPASHARQITELLWEIVYGENSALEQIPLRMAEEARPDYLVIPLAATTYYKSGRWNVELPSMCPIPLDELVNIWLALIPEEALAQVRQEWEKVRTVCASHGITLPEGRLIYISDWL